MAYKITDKPNAEGVSGTYPYGSIKDNTGGGNGVPVNRLVYTDIHQFFARIADLAGVVLNSLPDNAVNGWQFVTALQTLINMAVSTEASIRAAADTTLQNNKAEKSITILPSADNLLTGGGDLSANRTFSIASKVTRGSVINGASGGGGDCDSISDSAMQVIFGGIANGPGVTEYFLIFSTNPVVIFGGIDQVQVAIQVTGASIGNIYVRSHNIGGWTAWVNANV